VKPLTLREVADLMFHMALTWLAGGLVLAGMLAWIGIPS
jgi:hypothetical protein